MNEILIKKHIPKKMSDERRRELSDELGKKIEAVYVMGWG